MSCHVLVGNNWGGVREQTHPQKFLEPEWFSLLYDFHFEIRASQRRTRDPEQICFGILTNVKMDGRISQQVSGSWH